jgi:hypothetical protein
MRARRVACTSAVGLPQHVANLNPSTCLTSREEIRKELDSMPIACAESSRSEGDARRCLASADQRLLGVRRKLRQTAWVRRGVLCSRLTRIRWNEARVGSSCDQQGSKLSVRAMVRRPRGRKRAPAPPPAARVRSTPRPFFAPRAQRAPKLDVFEELGEPSHRS